MDLRFRCPSCEGVHRVRLCEVDGRIACRRCGWSQTVTCAAHVERCLACGCAELYQRKDFPQRLGLALVFLAIGLSLLFYSWYWIEAALGVLLAAAALDAVLYVVVGDVLVCYACGTEYRQYAHPGRHGRFSLEVAERYRQERARLDSMR